jgi:hypothetical protein
VCDIYGDKDRKIWNSGKVVQAMDWGIDVNKVKTFESAINTTDLALDTKQGYKDIENN